MTKIAQLKSLTQQYLSKYGKLFICLSGVSGAGKTYTAQRLAKLIGLQHIDQDAFFAEVRPVMTLSDGTPTENWDCTEALDLHKMSYRVHGAIAQGLIFSGFACRNDWFQDEIDLQMHLFIDQPTCVLRRQEQHKDPPHLAQLIVREQVWPFYQETLLESSYEIAFNGMHKSPNTLIEVINYLIDWFETHLGLEPGSTQKAVQVDTDSESKAKESFPIHYSSDIHYPADVHYPVHAQLVEQVVSHKEIPLSHRNDDPIVSHMGGRIYYKGDQVSPDFYKNVAKYLSADM